MAQSTLSELTAYLESRGRGTRATTIFYGELPEDPDAIISLMMYGGAMDEFDMGTDNVRLEFPHIQAITRGVKDDYVTPEQMLRLIVKDFARVGSNASAITLSGTKYNVIMALQPPHWLKQDKNFRHIFVCNFRVEKEPSTTS